MKYILISLLFFINIYTTISQNNFRYVGGMFYGLGYFMVENNEIKTNAASTVIGGRMGFYLKKNIFIGIIGNANTIRYQNNSYIRKTFFGVASEYRIPFGCFSINPGIWLGGGVMRNLHVTEIYGNIISNAILSKESYFFIYPYLQLTYSINSKFGILLMSEFINPISGLNKPSLLGTNIRIGIVFKRGN